LQMFMPMVISKIPLSLPKLAKSKRRSREYQLNYRIIPLFLETDLIGYYSLEKEYGSTSWLELAKPRNIIRVHCAIFTHLWSQYSGTNIHWCIWPQFHSIVMSQPPCELHYFYSIVRQSLRIIGTNAILYFIVDLFQAAGFTGNNALLSASIQLSSMLLWPSRLCYGWINGLADVSWCLDPFSWQCSYLRRPASWHPTGMPSQED
jgi:hypothetical protein